MTPFEYALVLISILISLALADIVMSLHKLLRIGRKVLWDGRLIVAVLLVVVEIVRIWFTIWTGRDVETGNTFSVFLVRFFMVMLLVLLAASSLPDEVGEECDTSTFYDRNRSYFWGVFACYQLSYFLLWQFVFGGTQAAVSGTVTIIDWVRIVAPLAIYTTLAFVRLRWLDYAAPLLILIFYLGLYWNQALAA